MSLLLRLFSLLGSPNCVSINGEVSDANSMWQYGVATEYSQDHSYSSFSSPTLAPPAEVIVRIVNIRERCHHDRLSIC